MSTEASQILDAGAPKEEAVQAPSTEIPNPTAAPTQKADERISPKLEVLIRREQAAVNRERAAKAKEQELEAKLKRYEEFESVKSNPKKALEMLGLDYNQLTQSLISDGSIPPEVHIKKLEEKFDSLKSETEQKEQQRKQEEEQRAQQNAERAIQNFKGDITTYLSDNKERYELIEFEGQQELVFDVIDEHYNRTLDPESGIGKVMSIQEAADKVEEHLEKKYNDSKKLNKVKTLWGAVPAKTMAEVVAKSGPSQKPKTLTNQMASTNTPNRTRPMTDDERVQKAIEYAKGLRPG